jgi:cell division GTPase FtsZ
MYKTKIITVGGFGDFTAQAISQNSNNIDIVAINTDKQSLDRLPDSITKICISQTGHGTGASPALAYKMAQDHTKAIKEAIAGIDIAILVCGLGKGTGTGAGLYVLELLKEQGVYTLVNMRTPDADFDGQMQMRIAEKYTSKFIDLADAYSIVSNDTLLNNSVVNTIEEVYAATTRVVSDSITAVTSIVNNAGVRNVDLNDIKTVICGEYTAVINTDVIDTDCITAIGKTLTDVQAGLVVFETPTNGGVAINTFKAVTTQLKQYLPSAELITGLITNPDIDKVQVITIYGFTQTLYQKRATAGAVGGQISKK